MSAPLDLDALKHGPLRDGLCWDCDGEYGTRPIVDNLCYVNALIDELENARAELSDAAAAVDSEFARAERAEAAIARVEALITAHERSRSRVTYHQLRAALRGDR